MPDSPTSGVHMLAPAQVAELLGVGIDEVMALIAERRLRGVRVGSPARWRIEEQSVADYLDDEAESARRMALFHESSNASFPELWGTGPVRHAD